MNKTFCWVRYNLQHSNIIQQQKRANYSNWALFQQRRCLIARWERSIWSESFYFPFRFAITQRLIIVLHKLLILESLKKTVVFRSEVKFGKSQSGHIIAKSTSGYGVILGWRGKYFFERVRQINSWDCGERYIIHLASKRAIQQLVLETLAVVILFTRLLMPFHRW